MTNKFKNYAFISYCHADTADAEALSKYLASFRLPRGVVNECCESKRLQPIINNEVQGIGEELSEQVRRQLSESKCLLLVCSPESAKSNSINQQVKQFIDEGRVKQIVPFIVRGVPMCNGERECFPPALVNYFKENPSHELLGIDTQKFSRRKSYYSVVSALLDIPYTRLWDRFARMRRKTMSLAALAFLIVLSVLYYLAAPYSVEITLHDDHHPNLPVLRDADGFLGELKIGKISIPVSSLDTVIVSPRLPGYLRGQERVITFSTPYYVPVSQLVRHSFGFSTSFDVQLKRDDEFAVFSGRVWDFDEDKPIAGAWVEADGGKFWALTDSMGCFVLRFSLDEQSETKSLTIRAEGYENYYDEETVIDRDVPFGLKRK